MEKELLEEIRIEYKDTYSNVILHMANKITELEAEIERLKKKIRARELR
jgi:hypothetical protein